MGSVLNHIFTTQKNYPKTNYKHTHTHTQYARAHTHTQSNNNPPANQPNQTQKQEEQLLKWSIFPILTGLLYCTLRYRINHHEHLSCFMQVWKKSVCKYLNTSQHLKKKSYRGSLLWIMNGHYIMNMRFIQQVSIVYHTPFKSVKTLLWDNWPRSFCFLTILWPWIKVKISETSIKM